MIGSPFGHVTFDTPMEKPKGSWIHEHGPQARGQERWYGFGSDP